jgi:glycosyltransferase involved in cell wall biosynthesis
MRLVLTYKNFATSKHVSHIGLGVAAINTSKFLRRAGVPTEVWPIVNAVELAERIRASLADRDNPVTHVVVSAPWISPTEWMLVLNEFPFINFSMSCHSNVGFLQADTRGCENLIGGINLEQATANFKIAGNSQKFVRWVQDTYSSPCAFLPNLYYTDHSSSVGRPAYNGGTLRIGAFGATRPLKNFLSAVGAACQLANEMRVATEIHVSGGRAEGGGLGILSAAQALVKPLPNVELKINNWQAWPDFRRTVGFMHVLMQPSYTESFNMVTADGISQGVPSVVSDAIYWVPDYWKAPADNVDEIARIARQHLSDPKAIRDGIQALDEYNRDGLRAWNDYLNGREFGASDWGRV